jgi:hypothetical protein
MLTIPLVREADASDERVREAFRDIKATLRVSLVPQLFQAWATVPRFLDATWRRLRPNVLSPVFIEQAHKIGGLAERAVSAWPVGNHAAALRARNASEAEIARMREICAMFNNVDPKLLLIAHAVRLALGGVQVGGGGTGGRPNSGSESQGDFQTLPVTIVDERDAPLRVRTALEDIKTSFAMPLVPLDYRAIAAFPDWLDVWWEDCKTTLSAPRHAVLIHEVDEAAIAAAPAMPYRVNLADETLQRSEVSADDRARIARINDAFCEALPGVLIGMAFAQRGLSQQT